MKENKELKVKYFKTVCLSLAFLSVGLFIAIIGPTLPTLAYNLFVDIESISYVLTARGFGYLLGSIISGLIYNKFDVHLMMFFALILTSVGAVVVPFVSYVSLLALALSSAGLSMGFLDTAGNVVCLQTWGDKSGPFMQTLHFSFAVGTTLAPFVAVPFIMSSNSTLSASSNHFLNSTPLATMTVTINNATAINGFQHLKFYPVTYAFVVCGVFSLIVSISFLYLGCSNHISSSSSDQKDTIKEEGRKFRCKVLGLLFLFFLVYVGVEVTFGVYIYTFAIHCVNHYSKTTATALNSLFWGTFALGRFLSIPLSKWCSPGKLIKADLFGTFVAAVTLACFPLYAKKADFLLWIAVSVYGISMASIFPSGVSWAEEYITVTGKAAMVFVVGASTGEMLCPLLVGQFIEINPMNLMYFCVFAVTLSILNFIALIYVTSSRGKRLQAEGTLVRRQEELAGLIDSSDESDIL